MSFSAHRRCDHSGIGIISYCQPITSKRLHAWHTAGYFGAMPAAMHLPQLRECPCIWLTLAIAVATAVSLLTPLLAN
jgi:hypothetical protein